MTRHNTKRTPPGSDPDALWLERIVLGDLSPDEARELEARLGPSRVAERRREIEADNALFLERFSPERVVPQIERRYQALEDARRSERSGRSYRRTFAWVTPAVAVAAVLLAVWLGAFGQTRHDVTPGGFGAEATRIKGLEPGLHLYRDAESGSSGRELVQRLADGDVVRPGDVVQVGYVAAGRPYGAIVSIDGAGAVTLHAPDDPAGSPRLEAEGEVLLQHGFRLDDAPSFERFFFVTAETPLSAQRVIDSARLLAADPADALVEPLSLPEGWEQSSITLRKDSR